MKNGVGGRRFVRKAAVVDALEWTGGNIEEVVAFVGASPADARLKGSIGYTLSISTPDGECVVDD